MSKYLAKYGKITGYGSPYWEAGLDVDLRKGDPVYSPKNGKVVFAGVNGGFGNQVVVETATGTRVMLSHLDGIDVKVGDILKKNQIVGKGGNSGKVIAGPGGDGSHLDITIKKPDGRLMTAKEVEQYVNRSDYRTMADNIIKGRQKGYTDTDILNILAQKSPEFVQPIEQARQRYKTDKNIKNDRDLTNFLAKKFSGVDRLSIASNPLPNEFQKQGYSEDQIVSIGKSYNLFDGSEGPLKKLYQSGDTQRFNDLIQAAEKSRISTREHFDDTIGGKATKALEKGIDIVGDIFEYTGIPKVAEVVVSGIGGFIGKKIGEAGQGVLETGKVIKQVATGKASEIDIKGAEERIKQAGEKYGEKTAEFGASIGREGARQAPLLGAGKALDAAMLAPVLSDAALDYSEGNTKGAATSLALGAISIWGIKNNKGLIINKEVSEAVGNVYNNTVKKGATKVGEAIKDTYINLPGQKSKIVGQVNDDLKGIVRPTSSKFKTESERVKYYGKLADGAQAVVENRPNLRFIREGEEIIGELPKNLQEAVESISQTRQDIFRQYDASVKEATGKGAEIELQPVITELEAVANNKVVQTLRPEVADYALRIADSLKATGKFTADEAQTAIQELNNSLKAFYKSPDYNNASKAVVDASVANIIRKTLDDKVSSLTGAEYQLLKNRYGSLKELETEFNKRLQRELNKNKAGLIDYTDIFSAGDIITGLTRLDPTSFARGTAQMWVKNAIKRLNDPDRKVNSLFKNSENLKKIQEKEISAIRKQYAHSLDEAMKNQRIIGGRIEKGFYVPTAENELQALQSAEIMLNTLGIGRADTRMGTSLHAWVNKNGKIFDTSLQDGFVKNNWAYVNEAKLVDFMQYKDNFKYKIKENLLPPGQTVFAQDKYAGMPNRGAFIMTQDEAAEYLDSFIAKQVAERNPARMLPEKGSPSRQEAIELPAKSQSLRDKEEIARIQAQIKAAKTPLEKQAMLSAVGGAYGIEPVKDENGNITGWTINAEKMAFGLGASMLAVNAKNLKKFEGFKQLSTKLIEDLKGKDVVNKQFIEQRLVSSDLNLKQVEKDFIKEKLSKYEGKVNVEEFANDVKSDLLPLYRRQSGKVAEDGKRFRERYEYTALPENLRGEVLDYRENIYESNIKTSAGDTHFGDATERYFGHTRIEDMADRRLLDEFGDPIDVDDMTEAQKAIFKKTGGKGDTRRVIEVQSDLYQKGRLERELQDTGWIIKNQSEIAKELGIKNSREEVFNAIDNLSDKESEILYNKYAIEVPRKNVEKLSQYSNPTAHFRMVREEVKQAAIDGKSKLQFPTGETALKIEGLNRGDLWFDVRGETGSIKPQDLKIGMEIARANQESWIITEVLGDGKFKAVEKNQFEKEIIPDSIDEGIDKFEYANESPYSEQFDISGKIDTNNPIYKFYEKDLAKYLQKEYGAKMITDKQGVKWFEVDVKSDWKDLPVNQWGFGTPESIGKMSAGMLAILGIGYAVKGKELSTGEGDEQEKNIQTPVGYVDFDENGKPVKQGQMSEKEYQAELVNKNAPKTMQTIQEEDYKVPPQKQVESKKSEATTTDEQFIENKVPDVEQADIEEYIKGITVKINNNKSLGSSILAERNNNPGNLRFAGQPGATKGDGGFAKFDTPELGFRALIKQVQLDQARNFTLRKFIEKYAPPGENDTEKYIGFASESLGISESENINKVNPIDLSKSLAWFESHTVVE